jgi:hypothetical protein
MRKEGKREREKEKCRSFKFIFWKNAREAIGG